MLSEGRSTSAKHDESKLEGKSHHSSSQSQSAGRKEHRDDLALSSKQVSIYLVDDAECVL